MLAYAHVLVASYYAQNYASIICQCLTCIILASSPGSTHLFNVAQMLRSWDCGLLDQGILNQLIHLSEISYHCSVFEREYNVEIYGTTGTDDDQATDDLSGAYTEISGRKSIQYASLRFERTSVKQYKEFNSAAEILDNEDHSGYIRPLH